MLKTLPLALALAVTATAAMASSHREAPFITTAPKVDGTDFYMFRSYEPGRSDFTTLIANYLPLQDAYGGPNYFTLDPNALYEIHIDNNGDANEDITFQFRFTNTLKGIPLMVGGKSVPIPLIVAGGVGPNAGDTAALNLTESYTVDVVRGNRRTGTRSRATNASGGTSFMKPVDNIGNKTLSQYQTYANQHIQAINIPGCSAPGKVFVGQRREGFVVNLGETFDLINIAAPAEEFDANARNAELNTIANKNITSIALEVPSGCLASGGTPIVGAWTTASLRQARVLNGDTQNSKSIVKVGNTGPSKEGGAWTQVSRLGAPLINEVIIGIPDKDRFNGSKPKDDGQFATYVTNPTLPALIEILFGSAGAKAPTLFPRTDLVAAFLTGVPGLNQPPNVVASEMLRLNTSTAVTAAASQNDLGVIAGDNAGFPNGRRPIDDVVDIELRVAMGFLIGRTANGCDTKTAPACDIHFTDGARPKATDYDTAFPYLKTPLAGSPGN